MVATPFPILPSLLLLLLLPLKTVVVVVTAQSSPLGPISHTGPRTCPSDPSVRGYTNTTTLHLDMIQESKTISDSGLYQNEYLYVLCPNTIFDMGDVTILNNGSSMNQDGYPLIPLLTNTTFSCGLNGRKEDSCILRGGHTQVHFFDFLITDYVVFAGLTFDGNVGDVVNAAGNLYSSALFFDCVIENNKGDSAVMIYFDGNPYNRRLTTDNNDNTHDMDPTLSSIMNKRQSRQKLINHSSLHDMKSTYESFLGDTFVLTNDELSSFIETPVNNNNFRRTLSEIISEEHRLWFGIPDDYGSSSSSSSIAEFRNDDNNAQRRHLQMMAAPAMSVYFHSSAIIDNMMNVAGVLNVGGLLQLDDSEVSFNQIGLATITNIYGAAIVLFSNTHFESNYDRLGPIFIDQHSHLILNQKSVTGVDNRGGSNCDIFTEDIGSAQCINTNDYEEESSCQGSCCDFGDESCDYVESEAPSESPTSFIVDTAAPTKMLITIENEIESEMKTTTTTTSTTTTTNTVAKSTSSEAETQTINSSNTKCDSTCAILSVVLPLTAIISMIVGCRLAKRNKLPKQAMLTTDGGGLGGDVEITGSRVL